MSFLDSLVDISSGTLGGIWNALTGPGVAGGIAKAAGLAFLLKEVTDSIQKDNQRPDTASSQEVDKGSREQINPDPNASIPVVYGQAFVRGIVTDARLVNSNQSMWYCLVLSEKTGTLINGDPSSFSFEAVYWNNNRINFQSDGITAASYEDPDGNTSTEINNLIKIYCYTNGSLNPVVPTGYTNGTLASAYTIFPEWTTQHTMNELVFALVRIDYSKENNVTGLGNLQFKLKNTMSQPGDVLYDYMTNTRYGAGLPAGDIFSS